MSSGSFKDISRIVSALQMGPLLRLLGNLCQVDILTNLNIKAGEQQQEREREKRADATHKSMLLL